MNDDVKILQQRAALDERRFLINSLDPELAPRIAPASRAIRETLADQRWHSFTELAAAGVRASDLAVRTVSNLIARASKAGMIEKRGEYVRKGGRAIDSRMYRIVEWPEEGR